MRHHINKKGQFQSDKFPELAPDKMVLSFKDILARHALKEYAELILGNDKMGLPADKELAEDILERLKTINE